LFEDHVAKSANKQKTKKVCDRTPAEAMAEEIAAIKSTVALQN
jgi:hypothetical protein